MDIKQSLEFRKDRISMVQDTGDNKYDYARYGVMSKCLPKILFKGNSVLVTFLQLIDLRIILLMKYVDKVKRFKWVNWY